MFEGNQRGNSRQFNRKPNDNYRNELPKITKPLSEYYEGKDLYLTDGVAYKKAEKLTAIPPHQLRKILDQSKQAVLKLNNNENNIDEAKKILFMLVPMFAYNAGRDKKLRSVYEFIQEHITIQSIQTSEDIKLFDELFTNIIAYHKFLAKK